MPGHAGPGFGAVRSFSRDNSVTRQQLAPGTLRRVGAFARPYRGRLAAFVGLILVEAALGASVPLVYREIIDGGIAGIHIEDQLYPKRAHYHKYVAHAIPEEEFRDKIRASPRNYIAQPRIELSTCPTWAATSASSTG